jgi:hypothetical protein
VSLDIVSFFMSSAAKAAGANATAARRGPPAKAKVSREIGAWRDLTLVELDKNATLRGGFTSHFENS